MRRARHQREQHRRDDAGGVGEEAEPANATRQPQQDGCRRAGEHGHRPASRAPHAVQARSDSEPLLGVDRAELVCLVCHAVHDSRQGEDAEQPALSEQSQGAAGGARCFFCLHLVVHSTFALRGVRFCHTEDNHAARAEAAGGPDHERHARALGGEEPAGEVREDLRRTLRGLRSPLRVHGQLARVLHQVGHSGRLGQAVAEVGDVVHEVLDEDHGQRGGDGHHHVPAPDERKE